MIYGGFLIYHTPRLRVFIDDRWELYRDEFVFAYLNAGPDEFREWEKKYSFEIALVHPSSKFTKYLDADKSWYVIKRAEAGVLYKKQPTKLG
jgi:hypothetical protein